MTNTVQLIKFYGNLQPFQDYEAVGEGRDYVILKNGVRVPDHMLRRPGDRVPTQQFYDEREEEDDFSYSR